MKKILFICPLLLNVVGQPCLAASTYVFSGHIDSVTGLSGTTDNFFADQGIHAGAEVHFSTYLDAQRNGLVTDLNGMVTYDPFYEHTGVMTSQDSWYRYAMLSASNVDISQSSIGNTYNHLQDLSYWSSNSQRSYSGSINVGSFLSIFQNKAFGDVTAFVENWKVGDSLAFCINYKNGSNEVFTNGQLQLIRIDTPLERISTVPTPGSIWLLGSSLLGVIGSSRRNRKRGI